MVATSVSGPLEASVVDALDLRGVVLADGRAGPDVADIDAGFLGLGDGVLSALIDGYPVHVLQVHGDQVDGVLLSQSSGAGQGQYQNENQCEQFLHDLFLLFNS